MSDAFKVSGLFVLRILLAMVCIVFEMFAELATRVGLKTFGNWFRWSADCVWDWMFEERGAAK